MTTVHETACPRLKKGVTPAELAEGYIPTERELALAMRTSARSGAKRRRMHEKGVVVSPGLQCGPAA